MWIRTLAVVSTALALAGCAIDRIDADVSSYSRWPSGRVPRTYVFERLPSQQAQPQQAQLLEDSARLAVEGAGFAPAVDRASADVTVQVGARLVVSDRSPFDDPFWYGPYGPWHRPFVYARYGRSFRGPGWHPWTWGPYDDFPSYEREVAVLIRDRESGTPLYESHAESEGASATAPQVLSSMFFAALRDFPTGSASNPHRVVVEGQPKP